VVVDFSALELLRRQRCLVSATLSAAPLSTTRQTRCEVRQPSRRDRSTAPSPMMVTSLIGDGNTQSNWVSDIVRTFPQNSQPRVQLQSIMQVATPEDHSRGLCLLQAPCTNCIFRVVWFMFPKRQLAGAVAFTNRQLILPIGNSA